MNWTKHLALGFAALVLASCGQSEQAGAPEPVSVPAVVSVPGTKIFSNDYVQVGVDPTNIYIEADCGNTGMDAYLFLHFVSASGAITNADFGFDDNAPVVSEGPPARCRATRQIPTGTNAVEVGQMVVGGDYIWNVTHELEP